MDREESAVATLSIDILTKYFEICTQARSHWVRHFEQPWCGSVARIKLFILCIFVFSLSFCLLVLRFHWNHLLPVVAMRIFVHHTLNNSRSHIMRWCRAMCKFMLFTNAMKRFARIHLPPRSQSGLHAARRHNFDGRRKIENMWINTSDQYECVRRRTKTYDFAWCGKYQSVTRGVACASRFEANTI